MCIFSSVCYILAAHISLTQEPRGRQRKIEVINVAPFFFSVFDMVYKINTKEYNRCKTGMVMFGKHTLSEIVYASFHADLMMQRHAVT